MVRQGKGIAMKENSLSIGRLSALVLAVAALAVAFVVAMPTAAHAADYAAATADSFAAAADVQAPALSAATTTKTVKKQSFTTELKVAKKKALVVKKGTTKLKVKGKGYVVFKAPKTKTYYLKLSNLKGAKPVYSAYASIMTPTPYSSITHTQVVTKGGKTDTLWLADKANAYTGKKVTTASGLASRTAKIKLKKGSLVFVYINSGDPIKATLNIK